MSRSRAAKRLLLCILGYLFLWVVIPRATLLGWLAASSYNKPASGLELVIAGMVHGWAVGLPMLAFMAVQIAAVYYFTMLGLRWWGYLLTIILSLAFVAVLLTVIVHTTNIPAVLHRYPNFREQIFVLGHYYGPLKLPISIAFIAAAAGIGGLVSFAVVDKNLLLPVALFAAAIDFWTVNYGVVSVAMNKAPEIVSAVSVPIPHAGTRVFIPNTMIGPGDFLFLALLFACVYRLKLDGARNYWIVLGTMSIGMILVMFNILPFLPALTVLAIGIILANYRQFKLSRQEKISVAVVAVALALSVPVVRGLVSKSASNHQQALPSAEQK